MKLTRFALAILATGPMWAGSITNISSKNNPLAATSSVSPENISGLTGDEVKFNFGTFTTTAFFNANGQATDSTNDGILTVTGTNGGSTTSNSVWDIQNNSGGPSLLGVTVILATAPSASGSAFSSKAVCADPALCPINATATFSSPVGLGGNPPGTTPFADLMLNFSAPLVDQSGFTFQQSTVSLIGPITNYSPSSSATPEPASVLFMAGGLLSIAGIARRRAKRASEKIRSL